MNRETAHHTLPTWLIPAAVVLVVVAILTSALIWIGRGKAAFATAHAAYEAGDCAQAVEKYALAARYPDWAGDFSRAAATEGSACTAYLKMLETAEVTQTADRPAIYAAFLAEMGEGPLASHALERFLEWTGTLRVNGEYRAAATALGEISTAHPDLERVSAEIRTTYLAWGKAMQTEARWPDAVAVYDELASRYPAYAEDASKGIRTAYLAWGEEQRQQGRWKESLETYDMLAGRGLAYAEDAGKAIEETYHAWDAELEKGHDYQGSIALWEDAIRRYPQAGELRSLAQSQIVEAYRVLSDAAAQQGDRAQIDTLYEQARRTQGPAAEVATAIRTQAYAEAAKVLAARESYPEAESLLKAVLQALLDQLKLDDEQYRDGVYDHFAVTGLMDGEVPGARKGPGSTYKPVMLYAVDSYFAVLGSTPDGRWLAIDEAMRTDAIPAEAIALPEVTLRQNGHIVYWVPSESVELAFSAVSPLPIEQGLARSLRKSGREAAAALDSLAQLYADWYDRSFEQDNFERAAQVALLRATLVATDAAADQALEDAAKAFLADAKKLAAGERQRDSAARGLLAYHFSMSLDTAREVGAVLIPELMEMAEQGLTDANWEAPIRWCDEVLRIERSNYGIAQATIISDTVLLETPVEGAAVMGKAVGGKKLQLMGRLEGAQDDWVLVFVPAVAASQAWMRSDQVKTNVMLSRLPAYPADVRLPLSSHAALRAKVSGLQQWMTMLARSRWESAESVFQRVWQDPDLQAVVTGMMEGAAQVLIEVGDAVWQDGNHLSALQIYAQVSSASPAASDALIARLGQLAETDFDCRLLSFLEGLSDSQASTSAAIQMPHALYNCAVEVQEQFQGVEKELSFLQRLTSDYPSSPYAAKAKARLPLVQWLLTFASMSDDEAKAYVERLCANAGQTAIAAPSIVFRPIRLLIMDPESDVDTWIPDAWPEAWKATSYVSTFDVPTVVLCVKVFRQELERCSYTGNNTLIRVQLRARLAAVEPSSGKTVGATWIAASAPPSCPNRSLFSGTGTTEESPGLWPSGELGAGALTLDAAAWLKRLLK